MWRWRWSKSLTVYFENHQANIHKIDIGRNKLKCSNCSYETFCNGTLNRHKAAVHNIGKKYECEQCLYKTATKRSLNYHQANKHNIDIGREKLKCDKCTYKTLYSNDMKRHITIKHSGTRKRTWNNNRINSALKIFKYQTSLEHGAGRKTEFQFASFLCWLIVILTRAALLK